MTTIRLAVLPIIVAALCALVASTHAAFSNRTANPANSFTADTDWVAPFASESLIARTSGTPSTLAAGAEYYVYANVADTGNPASGTQSVSADVSAITAGANAVPLSAGSFTVGSATYNRRSVALTADTDLAGGSHAYTLRLTDADGNSRTQAGFSIDATDPPTARTVTGSASGGASSTNTLTVDAPSSQPGDLMFAAVVSGATSSTLSAPAGWAPYGTSQAPGMVLSIFRKVATASEPGSYTFTSDAGNTMVGGIVAYGDVLESDLYVARLEDSGTSTHTTGALTVMPGTRLLSIFADSASGARTWTGSDNERIDVTAETGGGGSVVSMSMYDSTLLPAGTYTRSATASDASNNAAMWLIALRG